MEPGCSTYFTLNNNLGGTGVRLAFYLQIGLLAIFQWPAIFGRQADKATVNALRMLIVMVTGLTISTIVAAARGSLSFYNVLIAQQLLWLAYNYMTMVGPAPFPVNHIWNCILNVVHSTQKLVVDVLTLYLWATAYQFGPNPECTPSLKFYIVFWRLPWDFGVIRVLALMYYGTRALHALGNTLGVICAMCELDELAYDAESHDDDDDDERGGAFMCGLLFFIPGAVALIAPIELFVEQSLQGDTASLSNWSLGEILALAAVIPTMLSLLFRMFHQLRIGEQLPLWSSDVHRSYQAIEQADEGREAACDVEQDIADCNIRGDFGANRSSGNCPLPEDVVRRLANPTAHALILPARFHVVTFTLLVSFIDLSHLARRGTSRCKCRHSERPVMHAPASSGMIEGTRRKLRYINGNQLKIGDTFIPSIHVATPHPLHDLFIAYPAIYFMQYLTSHSHRQLSRNYTTSTMMDCSDYFTQNTDISGIGVRVAFYLQMTILMMQVSLSPDDAANVFWTLTSMVSGLMIAACISAANGSLSFYNAVVVQQLTWYRRQVYISDVTLSNSVFVQAGARGAVESVQSIPCPISRDSSGTESSDSDISGTDAVRGYFDALPVDDGISFRADPGLVIALMYYTIVAGVMIYTVVVEINKRHSFWSNLWWYSLKAVVNITPLELFLKQYPQEGNATSQWTFGQILALIAVLPPITSFVFSAIEVFYEPANERTIALPDEIRLEHLDDSDTAVENLEGQSDERDITEEHARQNTGHEGYSELLRSCRSKVKYILY
ncbi:hypothetical protein NM688_g7497 [Phlebia brevispora]|uniref:Uncharacterized protein n=1 Tax=Phlebia brevispora TaxID=194682 RepID=A0ACC1S4H6_9APHY|nr:hypothetical protein NM688_g7497 [Phlebia brevispora]